MPYFLTTCFNGHQQTLVVQLTAYVYLTLADIFNFKIVTFLFFSTLQLLLSSVPELKVSADNE